MDQRAWIRAAVLPGAVAVAVMVGALAAAPLRPSAVGDRPPEVDRIVIVAVPGLIVEDLGSGRVPTLDRLASQGATAAVATRGRSARPTVSEAYLSLSAGTRVRARVDAHASVSVDKGIPTRPGVLGSSLGEAGVRTAVIGASRPAVSALADNRGRVDIMIPTRDFVVAAPGRVRSDPPSVARLLRPLLRQRVVALVDTGDTTRSSLRSEARRIARGDAEEDLDEAERLRQVGLEDLDASLAAVRAEVDRAPGTLLVVAGITPSRDAAELSPLVLYGAGIAPGVATSTATDRPGLVTLTDLTPTLLGAVGARGPKAMTGRPILVGPGDGVAVVQRVDEVTRAEIAAYVPSVTSLFAIQSIVLVAGAVWLFVTRSRPGWGPSWWGLALAGALLTLAAWPVATFLAGMAPSGLPPPAAAVLLTWAIAVVIGVGALVLGRRGPPARPLLIVAAVSVVVISIDIIAGSRLQASTVLGHAPTAASRFHGVGNAAFGAYAAAGLVVAGLVATTGRDRRRSLAAAAAVLVVVLVLDVAPGLGADFGGVLSLVPAGLLLLALLTRTRVTGRQVALGALTVLGVTALVVGADLIRPAASRTHIGEFALEVYRDPGELWTTIGRKWSVNVASLRRTTWTRTLPAVILAVAATWASTRRRGAFGPESPTGPAVASVAALAVVGFLTNDSGLLVLGVAVVWLAPLVVIPALAADTGVLAVRAPVEVRPPDGGSVESDSDGRAGLRAPRPAGRAPRVPVEPAPAGVLDRRSTGRGGRRGPAAG